MNIRDLKYLVALIDHQHFGKAADACFVSQPALSMQIKKLEEHLGVQLLERTNKSVMFTDVGEVLAERARLVLSQVDEMKDIARHSADPYGGELRLGIFPTLAPYLLPHISPQIAKKFPRLSLYLLEEQTAFLMEKVMQGKIDAAILALPVPEKSLTAVPLFKEEFKLAVPKDHVLAKRKYIQQHDLSELPLLLLEEGHCLREQALTVCQRVQAKENQNFRATSLETLRHMVAAGIGATLMPSLSCQTSGQVVYVPFKKPVPMRSIGMVWRATTAKRQMLEEMAEQIGSIMTKRLS